MPQLPTEILQVILGCVYLPSDDRAWSLPGFIGRRRWLAATLSVSRKWLAAGLPVLYQRIELSPRKNLKRTGLLIRTFSKRPDLAHLVREIRFEQRPLFPGNPDRHFKPKRVFCGIGSRAWPKMSQPRIPFTPTKREKAARARKRAMRKIAEYCDRATILRFDAKDTAHGAETMDALAIFAPRIEVLEIYETSHAALRRIVDSGPWPRLQELVLSSCREWFDWGASGPLVTSFTECFPQINCLDISHITDSSRKLYETVEASRSTLRTLRCGFIFGPYTTTRNLDHGGSELVQYNLTELSFACEWADALPSLGSLASLRRLEVVLCYEKRRPDDRHSNTPAAGDTPVGAFSPLIEAIRWVASHVSPPEAVSVVPRIQATLVAVDAGVLPCLKHIHLHFDIQQDTGLDAWTPLVVNLSDCAARRGIDLQFTVTLLPATAQDEQDVFAQREMTRVRQPIQHPEPSTLQLFGQATLQCLCCLWGCIGCITYVGFCCCFTASLCPEVEAD